MRPPSDDGVGTARIRTSSGLCSNRSFCLAQGSVVSKPKGTVRHGIRRQDEYRGAQ